MTLPAKIYPSQIGAYLTQQLTTACAVMMFQPSPDHAAQLRRVLAEELTQNEINPVEAGNTVLAIERAIVALCPQEARSGEPATGTQKQEPPPPPPACTCEGAG